MSESTIDIIINPQGAVTGGATVSRVTESVKLGFLDLAAKVFVAQQAIVKIWDAAAKGAQFEETMGRLNRQMGQFGSNAHLMVGELQSISRGTLSVGQSATLASRALATGLNPDQIRTFIQAADALDDVLGTDLPTAFDNIVQAAITGRTQILANIGVYVDLDEEVKKLAVSTNRTTDQITKQEKAMLTAKAITAQAGDALHKLSDGALSDADRLKQVEAKWDNLWTSIGQGAKTATITALEWMERLSKGIEESVRKETMGRQRQRDAQPGAPNNPVTQQILGAAITQSTTGMINRQRDQFTAGLSTAVNELPSSLRGSQLDAERERKDRAMQGDLERTKAGLEAAARLVELDAQRQLATQEDLVNLKGTFRIRELAAMGESLNRQQQMEAQFHARRVAIGFESTEERIGEEERYRGKVVEINQALLTNAQAFGQQSVLNEEERAQARGVAEEQRGQRRVEQFKSQFDIQESLRRQDLDDAQTYYQGEFDMATARFASDQEFASKERALLREQLAFRLRLTQEEVDRLLVLRKAGDFEGVRQLSGRADPTLNPRAVEGIVESSTAKDILLAERANGDFFAGWTRGLQKYAQDRDSAFGLSADMARRAAQGMEQGFQTFFFDSMDWKFQSFKDVLAGVLDFTKQIVAQMAAQMVTIGLIKPGANALMSGFGTVFASGAQLAATRGAANPSLFGPGFAEGGMGNFGAGTHAVLHGPEAIVPLPDGRSIPVTMRHAGEPSVNIPIAIQVINQAPNTEVSATRRTPPGGGREEIMIMITQAVNDGIARGRHDKALAQRFQLSPGGG